MTYSEAVEYLYSQLPAYQKIGKSAYKADLSNIIELCKKLDNPQNKLRTIHIGGTNGKGSTSHALAALLQSQGLSVGLYTSPHLFDFRERIKINGKYISKQYVIGFVQRTKHLVASVQPSFFELTVALAFEYFVKQKIDVAIIEVGLGGRLDSTNIITPLLSVITNISLEHTDILGDTIEAIAGEKAGIIKSNIPVLISERDTQTVDVFTAKAKAMNSPLHFTDKILQVTQEHSGEMKLRLNGQVQSFRSDLTGLYQRKNLAAAIAAFELVKGHFNIAGTESLSGLNQVKKLTGFMGRWDKLNDDPLVYADACHNKAGMKAAVETIQSMTQINQVHCILGFSSGKDVAGILEEIPEHFRLNFVGFSNSRALDPAVLLKSSKNTGRTSVKFDSLNQAIQQVYSLYREGDLIFIGGSIFLLSELDPNYFEKEVR